ncbi:hypothetical protein HN777_02635 [Candidatus Woesearchaeota archaeon]|jgi:hypothetical protein|nr:hypothetical protein [Candidatus Woesearchaeota archaeon]MBT7402660.1 hypothetical protein [Candidatus Woesearchaeota archaeon]
MNSGFPLEFYNYYPISYYFNGIDKLKEELTFLLSCNKIEDKFYVGENAKVRYLKIDNGKFRIEYKRDFNIPNNSLVASYRLIIGVRSDIKDHKKIIKNLEERFRPKQLHET